MTTEEQATATGQVDEGLLAASQLASIVTGAATRPHGGRLAPDLIGLGGPDAHRLARAAGVQLYVSVWETKVGPWGLVIDQWPVPGAPVRRGSKIQVVVSGRTHAPVPDVCGLPLRAALELLFWAGLIPIATARRASDRVPPDHVESTQPVAGTIAKPGSVVALNVARSAGDETGQRA